jgi:uncharacterized protein YxeA
MSKNIIIAILIVITLMLAVFGIVQKQLAHQFEEYAKECKSIAKESKLKLDQCKSEAEQQRQMALNAERISIQMIDELRSKDANRRK